MEGKWMKMGASAHPNISKPPKTKEFKTKSLSLQGPLTASVLSSRPPRHPESPQSSLKDLERTVCETLRAW